MDYGFYDSLLLAKNKYGDNVIIKDNNKEVTYSNLLSMIDSIEEKLLNLGVKENEKIGILAYNCPEWLAFFFAIIKCKCVAVCLNYSFNADEVNEYCKLMDCKYLLYGDCLALSRDHDFVSKIQLDDDKKISFDSVEFKKKTTFEFTNISKEEFEKNSFIIFTSGSTGKVKGSMLTQKSSLYGAKGFLDAIYEIEHESLCVGLPLFHIFGLSMCISHILYGGMLYLPKNFSSSEIVSYLNKYKIDALGGVMTVIIRLLEDKDFSSTGYPNVKRLYTGGAPLMSIQCHRTERAFGDAIVLNCYGQSETDAGITITTPRDSYEKRVNSVGKPCSQREVYIMNNSQICKNNEVGEIVVKDNGTITKGYYNADINIQPIDQNGFLHTGDLGYIDDEGYLYLKGRIKDIIIKGGENINPIDIEKVMISLDEISDVKVIGAKNDLYGESVEACVVCNPSFKGNGDDLKAKLKGKISSFKMPSHIFIFDKFPLKPNGKLDACELSRLMLDKLNNVIINDDIKNGINVLSLDFRKQHYMISSIKDVTASVLTAIGIPSKNQINKIVICVEEMLIEIVNNAYLEKGNTKLNFILYHDYLRLSFINESDKPIFDEENLNNRTLSVTIIVNYANCATCNRLDNGIMEYNLDFLLPTGVCSEDFFK